jgi:hypothetical protein
MKHRMVFILICLLASLISCHKEKQDRIVSCDQRSYYAYLDNYQIGTLCTSDICQKYKMIWKELFMEKNNISESYFDEHIILCNSDTGSWNKGTSFNICYKVKIDWAIAWRCDQFIIKIKSGNNYYPSVDLPRDQFLSKNYIRTAIYARVFSSKMDTLSNEEVLRFKSFDSALDQLIKGSNVNTLCSNDIIVNNLGHLTLEAYGEYKSEYNSCIMGEIDLISGNTKHNDTPCWIN